MKGYRDESAGACGLAGPAPRDGFGRCLQRDIGDCDVSRVEYGKQMKCNLIVTPEM